MCEANVYIRNKGEKDYQLLLEAVDKVIPGDGEHFRRTEDRKSKNRGNVIVRS